MICPKCGCPDSIVVDSRKHQSYVNRRRDCCNCSFRFYTIELAELDEKNLTRIRTIMKHNSNPRTFEKALHQMYMKCFHFSQYMKQKGLKDDENRTSTAE